ncbi:MAG TPA: HepT-like ribonuclease domain-containing protein [Mucilaginibacter sp.]|nr:HepT-like ribonuclease domain-containing protein [Mucilaginibacter sp.]
MSFEAYCSDIKTKHAVEHNFMIIGEAVSRMPSDFKQKHSFVDWRVVKDFRNVIAHDYFGIDNSIVWDIIKVHLPDLSNDITQIIQNEKGNESS